MKQLMIEALRKHAIAHVEKHRANVEIYLRNPVGVGEHGDIMDTIEKELDEMARYEDQLEILDKYFVD
jgi:hypothetical protein